MQLEFSRRKMFLGGVAVLAALGGAGLAWRHASSGLSLTAEKLLWEAEFDTPDGQVLALQSYRGRPLVVNFWATWCTPCIEEMPLLDAFFQQKNDKSWQMIGLAIDQPSRVRQFLDQHPVNYPIGLAGMGGTELVRQLGNDQGGLPFTVVLDAQGALVQRKLGKLSPSDIKSWA